MKSKIYLFSNFVFKNFIRKLFVDYEIIETDAKNLKENNLKNKNILLVVNNIDEDRLSSSDIKNNNVFVFTNEIQQVKTKYKNTNMLIFSAPTHIEKLIDAVNNYFRSNIFIFEDVKIIGEALFNTKENVSCPLTFLEKKILIEFIENKTIKREYFLEKILGIRKEIRTKTIESHLTRIRKKLISINSNIQITSKGDVFFLNI